MHKVWAVKVVCDGKATPSVANGPHYKYLILSRGSLFISCLVVLEDKGWAALCSLTNNRQDMNQIPGTQVYISVLPAYTSILFSTHIKHTDIIPNHLVIMLLAQNNVSLSKSHKIT
jgi:hypothetical protein